MKKSWYIEEYEEKEYLHNKTLYAKKIIFSQRVDHVHCELCWQRLSNYKDDQDFGYYEPDSISFICERCFNSFKDLFGWKLSDDGIIETMNVE